MHQRRLVLRDSTHETGPDGGVVYLDGGGPTVQAELIARGGHWPLVEQDRNDTRRTRCWGIAPDLWMRHIEDQITATSVLVFFGEDLFAVAEIVRRVTVMFNLHPYTREELLSLPFSAADERARVRAVLRVALAIGDTDDPELFEVLKATARDEAAGVRNATAYAISYLAGKESLRLLATIAEDDPDDAVREGAAGLLAAWG